MTSTTDVVETGIEELAVIFENESVDFFLEADIQARLYEILRRLFREQDELRYPPTGVWTKPVQNSERSSSVQQYDDWYKQHSNVDGTDPRNCKVTRVHTETWVKGWEYIDAPNNSLDLAVFSLTPYRPIQLFKGRKQVESEAIGAAIELKYIRNKENPSSLHSKIDIDKDDLLKNSSSLTLKNGVEKDLTRLEEFSADYQRESYFVLATHYDPLSRGWDRQNNSRIYRVEMIVAEAIVDHIQSDYPHVNTMYMCPGFSEWITQT